MNNLTIGFFKYQTDEKLKTCTLDDLIVEIDNARRICGNEYDFEKYTIQFDYLMDIKIMNEKMREYGLV